ncbi:hypothetical protein CEXT_598961 [Caerostris extrusa]|uniref:Uncharacterized protein n=1 Tax=Caerostris extrusa TaxID=172846 RepID=A0AAV4YFI3_CAEEX|nr:hypothetical protein CEXT_598961 [Caerostris extrusa]
MKTSQKQENPCSKLKISHRVHNKWQYQVQHHPDVFNIHYNLHQTFLFHHFPPPPPPPPPCGKYNTSPSTTSSTTCGGGIPHSTAATSPSLWKWNSSPPPPPPPSLCGSGIAPRHHLSSPLVVSSHLPATHLLLPPWRKWNTSPPPPPPSTLWVSLPSHLPSTMWKGGTSPALLLVGFPPTLPPPPGFPASGLSTTTLSGVCQYHLHHCRLHHQVDENRTYKTARKPPVSPKVPMKPLYWTRIQVQDPPTVHLFQSLLNFLIKKRSQNVGILISSLRISEISQC